jgi:hypothetical protein
MLAGKDWKDFQSCLSRSLTTNVIINNCVGGYSIYGSFFNE